MVFRENCLEVIIDLLSHTKCLFVIVSTTSDKDKEDVERYIGNGLTSKLYKITK